MQLVDVARVIVPESWRNIRLPYPLDVGLKYVYGCIPVQYRLGSEFVKTYAFLQDSQWWDRAKLETYQLQQLQKLLDHAYKNVPYYRSLFDSLGLRPEHVQDFSDLERIPFLTKEIIRNNLSMLKATNFPDRAFAGTTTGGSSGTPLSFYNQRGYSRARERAFIATLWDRVGFRYGKDARLVLRGHVVESDSGVEYRPVEKELICSTYHMDDDHLWAYFRQMKDQRIRFVHGHVSSVAIFAQFMVEQGLSHNLQAVLGASEKVYPFQRELTHKAFGTRIFSWYGQSEQVVLAGECELSEYYHIFPEYGFTELVDENGKRISSAGKAGEIVGTGFNNYVMPFIRYRTGDIAKYASDSCDCGRAYRLLEDVEGRTCEYVFTEDGRKVSLTGLVFGQHFRAFERIKKIQLYQDKEGQLEIRIVKSSDYSSEDEHEVRTAIQKAVRSGLEMTFCYVNDIPQTGRGKHRLLIQKLPVTFGC
jgi:phenylacetate-CoA ligase